ncbi:cyclin-I-like, partial [Stigmatopora argus]
SLDCVIKVDSVEFIHCKESVDEHLRSLEFSVPANAVYIFDSAHIRAPARHPRQRIGKGQSADQLGDLDEYYDGLRHLYDEEQSADSAGSVGGSLFDSPQESTSPCPPLYSPS